MAKTKWIFAKLLRSVEVPVTQLDADGVALVELPKGLIESIKVSVDDAFASGATLELKLNGTVLVAAHALDATGYTAATLTGYVHNSTSQQMILTGTVSNKTETGSARVIVNFALDRDTNLR